MENWPILKLVPVDLAGKITAFHVFGAGNLALFVTADDEVHAISLFRKVDGDEDSPTSTSGAKIDSLCNKQITAFSDAGNVYRGYFLALSKNGDAFTYIFKTLSWPMIGNSSNWNVCTNEIKIAHIVSGARHSLFLTKDGMLYSCGGNHFGQRGIEEPVKSSEALVSIPGISCSTSVIAISCSAKASACITSTGDIYTWGAGPDTGHNTTQNITTPRKLNLSSIKKVACGVDYMLALSTEGTVFAWGSKLGLPGYQEIGAGSVVSETPQLVDVNGRAVLGNQGNVLEPSQISFDAFIVDIAAHRTSYTSAAMTAHGEIFVWGECGGLRFDEPHRVSLPDLDSVFAHLSAPKVTLGTIQVEPGSKPFHHRLLAARDDQSTCDVVFNVSDKKIHAHKTMLKIHCEYFRTMFNGEWKEANQEEIEVDDFSYDAYKAYIDYIYTNRLVVGADIAGELVHLAHSRLDDGLKHLCEKTLISNLKVVNLVHSLDLANAYELEKLKEVCLSFAKRNLSSLLEDQSFRDKDKEYILTLLASLGL